jgi:hypothetical protein
MSFNSAQFVTINPNYMVPELLMPYSQKSGAFELLAEGVPSTRLSEGDLQVYVKTVQVRTENSAGQSSYTEIPSCGISTDLISTPTYMYKSQAIYSHHDVRSAGVWGISLPEAERLAMRQSIFQQLRTALLYGMTPSNGEGIVNTPGVIHVTLPPDSNGNDTVVTYDNGQMAIFLLQQILNIEIATFQLGIPKKIVICGTQESLGYMTKVGIVQLTSYQRPGGGTMTSAQVTKEINEEFKTDVLFVYDDTLKGKGAGGTDLIIITCPVLETQGKTEPNTNEFAKLSPGLLANNTMYCDMAAPREIYSGTMPQGFTHVTSELRSTSGWGLRPELTLLVSMQYQ